MTKKLFPIIFFLSLFLVGGCIKLPFLGTSEPEAVAFAGGTQGLDINFQGLPSTIITEAPFDIFVLAENKGETLVSKETATFTLNNAETFGISVATINNKMDLSPVKLIKETKSPGGVDQVFWQGAIFRGLVLTEQQRVPLAVDVCYPYRTTAVSTICVARSSNLCQPVSERIIQSSGAPIQVTGLKQIAQPSGGNVELGLEFEIANLGSGDVFPSSAQCPAPNLSQKGVITIESLKLGSREVRPGVCSDVLRANCCSEVSIATFEDEGSANCRLSVETTRDFEEQLTLVLAYKYRDKITSEVSVIPF